MVGEKERVDAYQDTIKRLEPDIAMIDHDAAMASIAISLKRIADSFVWIRQIVIVLSMPTLIALLAITWRR